MALVLDNWFEDYESRMPAPKDQIPWPITVEYEIQSKYFVTTLKSLPVLDTATDAELLSAAQHCNNLIGWVEQMRIMGYTGLPVVMEDLLENEFGNRKKLFDLRRAYTAKWLFGKTGQHKIGENYFNIHQDKVYYCTLRHEWYEVETVSIFDIMPTLTRKTEAQTSSLLDTVYRPTRYQLIYTHWQDADYSGKLLPNLFASKSGHTTPEDVLKDTIKKLEGILENPPSLEEVEDAIGKKPDYLEYLIKISCLVADFAEQRRVSNEHTLYLLRDCAMFHEAQILIDLLESQPTSHDQIYLGRQSLSSHKRDAGHWYMVQELLLITLQKHPHDFSRFYAEFTQCMKDYEEYNPEFAALVQTLAKYLGNHIEVALKNHLAINVIDLGFQGSINMLVKYVLDNYCLQDSHPSTKIHMYVVAEWFKGVYETMFTSNTFSTLTHVEVMSRNNAIYEYVPWSLRDGKLLVNYGSADDQIQAEIELTVMVMTILTTKKLKAA
jgi:hypothetical protein